MPITLTQSATAVCPKIRASFYAKGGDAPYVYEVLPGGAGGTVDPATGIYTAPSSPSVDPKKRFDVIRATDYTGEFAEAKILVGNPLMLFCEIIQRGLGLADGRVYLWNQKIGQPSDSGLYVAVSVPAANPIGSSNRFNNDLNVSEQFVSMAAVVDIDLISRDASARDRKEELILALDSDYARRQQDANSFYISKLSVRFINLSEVDGAAIPYRYRATCKMQYAFTKVQAAEYFDQFEVDEIINS